MKRLHPSRHHRQDLYPKPALSPLLGQRSLRPLFEKETDVSLPQLRFSPLAWLKLQYLCHAGETEVGGFGISSVHDPLYIERVETVLQGTTAASVEFSDSSVADHFDRFADLHIPPSRCGRIWIHTHPGSSPEPSCVDEATFSRVFGPCDWALMFILSRTGRTYARLRYSSEAGGSILLPVSVDWPSWPKVMPQQQEQTEDLPDHWKLWRHEYDSNVYDLSTMAHRDPLDHELFEELMEREMLEEEMLVSAAGGWPEQAGSHLVNGWYGEGGYHDSF